MKLTLERLRQITTLAANTNARVVRSDPLYLEAKAMAEELLTLRDELAKAYHQHQFFVAERERARADRAAVFAEYDKARVENEQLRVQLRTVLCAKEN